MRSRTEVPPTHFFIYLLQPSSQRGSEGLLIHSAQHRAAALRGIVAAPRRARGKRQNLKASTPLSDLQRLSHITVLRGGGAAACAGV